MSRDLDGAKCAGLFWLFDSVDRSDHIEARKLCDTCPVKAACLGVLAETVETSVRAKGSMPTGTWGGQLIGNRGHALKVGTAAYNRGIRGKMGALERAARPRERELTEPGLTPVPHYRNGG